MSAAQTETLVSRHGRSDGDAEALARELQHALSDLVELYLQTKQLHWNVVGRGFRSLHESLDVLAADVLVHTDELAERMRALWGVPNIRTADIAASTKLEPAPQGEPTVEQATSHIEECLRRVVLTVEEVCNAVDPRDSPTVDVLHSVMLALDKHAWLLRAELRS